MREPLLKHLISTTFTMLHLSKHLVAIARSLALVATSFTLSLSGAEPARAQQYGPRLFWLAPSGIQIFQIQGFHLESNTSIDTSIVYPDFNIDIGGVDFDIETEALVFIYAPTFSVGETSGQLVFSIPYAWVDVNVSAGPIEINRNESGLADLYTEWVWSMRPDSIFRSSYNIWRKKILGSKCGAYWGSPFRVAAMIPIGSSILAVIAGYFGEGFPLLSG
jgi:hypothetical protein